MPETPQPASNPPEDKAKQKGPRNVAHGDLDKAILEDIQLAAKVGKAAHQVAIAPKLADEGITAEEADGVVAEADALKKISGEVVGLKKSAVTATAREVVAHKAHLAALRQIQNLAKRKFPSDKTARANYGIGVPNFGDNRETLEALSTDILTRAATEGFPGNIQAKIAAATTTLGKWKTADEAQATASSAYSSKLEELKNRTADLNARRRNIQLAGENIAPVGSKGSATIRRALGLPADRALA